VRGRDLRDVRHDAASRNGPAGPGPATDLAMILASSASTCAWTCSGRPSHRAGESSWPANKASCRAGAILRTRIGSPLPSFAAIRNEVNLLPFRACTARSTQTAHSPAASPQRVRRDPCRLQERAAGIKRPTRTPDHGARADPKDRSRAAPQPAPAPHRLTHPRAAGRLQLGHHCRQMLAGSLQPAAHRPRPLAAVVAASSHSRRTSATDKTVIPVAATGAPPRSVSSTGTLAGSPVAPRAVPGLRVTG